MVRFVAFLLVGAACGRGSRSTPAPSAHPVTPVAGAAAPSELDQSVAAANALVPAALRSQLRFEKRTIRFRGRVVELPAPAGWTPSSEGELERADEPKHEGPPYFPASFTVGVDVCDGEWTADSCSDKPAAEEVELGLLHSFRRGNMKIIADDNQPTEHDLKASDKFATYAVRAWWSPGAKRFSYCDAALTAPLQPAVNAFARACSAVHVK